MSYMDAARKGYDDYDAEDWEALWASIHPEFEFQTAGAFFEPELIRGPEEYKAFVGRIHDRFDKADIIDRDFIDAGDNKVLVTATLDLVDSSTGEESKREVAWLWTMVGDQYHRGQEWLDHAQAKADAGV
jgi:ketosteroid isomerase-like protein